MKPSIGRIVHYLAANGENPPIVQAALIIHVFSDTCVNLVTWNQNGTASTPTSVLLGDGASNWTWPARV